MIDPAAAIRAQLGRQIAHWCVAAARLRNLDDLAAASAWNNLERYLGLSIRRHLTGVVDRLERQGRIVRDSLAAAATEADLQRVRRQLLALRNQYLRVETTLNFYTDAVNTRTSPVLAGLLRACDTIAYRSMSQILDPLGKSTPAVLTYISGGRGASVLKAGLRLWDGASESPVAAIKIVRHNLLRPTALIHESGHQVAHVLGWNDELANALRETLRDAPAGAGQAWGSWASEIAADAFAFVHAGYGSVAGLHDVVADDERGVLRHHAGDPHPISYLRVLLGVALCRQCYGRGPWDAMALAWTRQYPVGRATPRTAELIRASVPLLSAIADVILRAPMRAFGGRSLSAMIDPSRVGPAALREMEQRLGGALYTSMHWIWTESLRLLALMSLRAATRPERAVDIIEDTPEWMLKLGGAVQAA